jgi:glyoxylase-like metal-dependent hydrolase (beta-lactamase superfamily II)
MRVREHGDTLVQLTRYYLIFPINSYFVREDDGLTLIDTGMAGTADDIIAQARRLGAPIARIVLTHAHGDHADSLDALHAQLPDAEVLVGAREARLLAGDHSLDPEEPQVSPGGFVRSAIVPTRLLAHGDRVRSLQVIAAPGHTPGQIALFDTRDRSLIVGDAFYTRGGIAVAGTINKLFPFPGWGTWHRPTAIVSARRLRDLAPSRLAVGHCKVIERPVRAMDRAIAAAERAVGVMSNE